MLVPEPLGVVGAPLQTLDALVKYLERSDLESAVLNLVTDSQGKRDFARYAALVLVEDAAVLTVDAFGPRYEHEGREALRGLLRWAAQRQIATIRETVVNTYDFNRLVREPDEQDIRQLTAAANPTDPNIYLA